ncbi:MAG: phage holin family protein [Myxococcales bacterium]|nr:phage holin family protein [Myxococcales bacterium]MCB9566182.1 phage holin family protein [Myxococcales bacterium]MCB9702759.1 phage holin family protein [Myxococcales bacterium]
MGPILASAGAFAIGLFVMATVTPNVRIKDSWGAFQIAGACGLISALLGKLVVAILSLLLLPILLAGPLGVFVLHALFNGVLLFVATRYLDGIRFDGVKSLAIVAAVLTLVQMIVRAGA